MDYYKVLGIERDASEEDVKTAYRKLALKYHPDRCKGEDDGKKFKELAEAFEIIGDKDKRAQYDRFGYAGPRPRVSASPFDDRFGRADLGDVFNATFTRAFHHAGRGTVKGTRIRQRISLEEAFTGCVKEVTVVMHEACKKCDNTGYLKWNTCVTCGGAGQVCIQQAPFVIQAGCSDCGGGDGIGWSAMG